MPVPSNVYGTRRSARCSALLSREEGELTIRVKEVNGSSKFEKIVTMIEESEKLKSSLEKSTIRTANAFVANS